MAEQVDARPYPSPLPPAPARLVQAGVPVYGTWAGTVVDAGFGGLAAAPGPLDRRLVEKKWVYLLVPLREAMLALAVVDAGYLSTGICAVFDRGARRLLADSSPVLPPLLARISDSPGEALGAQLAGPLVRARFRRTGDRIVVSAKWAHVAVDVSLELAGAPPALSTCCALAPGRFHFTQKLVGLAAHGEIRAGNTRFVASGERSGLDFSHGLLLRETRWRWAFATGEGRVGGINLSDGFVEACENAVWIDGAPVAVGPVRFERDAERPLEPWRVRSADGALDLAFRPEGQRAQTIDLKLISSRYVQPFGSFSGHVTSPAGERIEVRDLPGVAEDHEALW